MIQAHSSAAPHVAESVGRQVVLATGFVPNEAAERVVRELRPRLAGVALVHAGEHIYCTGWTELQIQHPLADKGQAIPHVLELSGLRSATVIACGDHLNDLGMFTATHESIAPANAHSAVLAAASAVVAGNDEDGVIHWLLSRAGLAAIASPVDPRAAHPPRWDHLGPASESPGHGCAAGG